MERSETINEIAGALAKAQGAIINPAKDKEVTVQTKTGGTYKFKYATFDAIVSAVKKPLSDNGLAFVQTTDTEENSLHLETTLIHSSGQWMSSTVSVKPAENTVQGLGATLTYLKRYALCALLGVVADEDTDGNTQATLSDKRDLGNGKAPLFSVIDADGVVSQPLPAAKAALAIRGMIKDKPASVVIAVYEHNESNLVDIEKLGDISDIRQAYQTALVEYKWHERAKSIGKKIKDAAHPDDLDAILSDPLMDQLKAFSEKAWSHLNEAAVKRLAELQTVAP